MRRALLLGIAATWQVTAAAQDIIPAHLAGVWGTAESLYVGTAAQSELYLQADGLGVVRSSSKAPARIGGTPSAEPEPRLIVGLPLRARLDGNVLMAQPFLPPGLLPPGHKAPDMDAMKMSCRYQAQEATLTCIGPDRVEMVMKRRSETLPPEAMELLKQMQAAG